MVVSYLDLSVDRNVFVIMLLIVIRIHAEVVERELLPYPILERLSLLRSQTITLGNYRNDVDEFGELLQDDNINGLEAVARGLNEEQAAVNAGVLEVAFTLGRQLLAQVGAVLVLNILDNGIPASLVVDQVTIARGVNNVQSQAHAILLNDMRNGLDLSGGADGLIGLETTLAVNQMRREDGVDESRFSQTGLSCYQASD